MFSISLLRVGFVVALCARFAVAQQCPYGEPAADSCGAPRVIPGTVGHHVVLMDASTATGTGSGCNVSFGKTVWFEVTPDVSGPMTVSTCHPGTSYDTVVQVYSGGDSQCEWMTIEDCEDDSPDLECSNGCSGRGSVVSIYAVANVRYRIEVGAYDDNYAGCLLCLGLIVTIGTPCGDPPRNLDCILARELPGYRRTHEVQVDVTDAFVLLDEPTPQCHSNPGHTVWFHVRPEMSGPLTFTTCRPQTSYDTVVQAYTGDCLGWFMFLPCNDDDSGDPACDVGCQSPARRGSTVTFDAAAGQDYYFQVGSYGQNLAGCDLCLGAQLTLAGCTTGADCDDGNPCTADACEEGDCVNSPQPPGTACPDDDNSCTDDVCDLFGTCTHPFKAAGTACGDPAATSCSEPDTCDGFGLCLPNHLAAGTRCESDGNDCTQDQCDGDGACTHEAEPNGTPCADDWMECTYDACDGGACTHRPLAFGTPCGDPSDTACTDPDICDGAGGCLLRDAPPLTSCSDDLFCNGAEVCDGGGSCVSGGPVCPPPFICDEDADACDTDCNANGIPDAREQGVAGAEVVQRLTPVADTYVDSGMPQANFNGDTHAPASLLQFGVQIERGQPVAAESWVAFDLSNIPAAATVVDASLLLSVHAGGFGPPVQVSLRPALSHWEESALTWNSRPVLGATAAESVIGPNSQEVLFNLAGLVQSWVSGDMLNYGVALQPSYEGADWLRFANSRESGSPPELVVIYRLPVCSVAFSGKVELSGFGPPEENPVAGMRLDLYGADRPGGLGWPVATAVTDQAGSYILQQPIVGWRPYLRYTLVVVDDGYSVVGAASESGGTATPEGYIEFANVAPAHYAGNLFRVTPAFIPPVEVRTFSGTVRTAASQAPAARVEVILYGADESGLPQRIIAGTSTGHDGSFRLPIESDPDAAFPYFVLQVADYEYEVRGAESPQGSPTGDHRIVFTTPRPGSYTGNIFEVQSLAQTSEISVAGAQPILRPIVVVMLTPQCTCAGCPNPCNTNPCRNITNPNVLTAFGQTIFAATGDSVHRFFLEMSQNHFGLSQAGLFQVVPDDSPATPNVNESTMCSAFPSPEHHRAWVAEHVLGNQLSFNFANFDANGNGTVEENELIVLLTATDPNTGNARMRASNPQTVRVGNIDVRVFYIMVQPGTDFYTIAHEIAHALPFTLRSGEPGDLYGGSGNAGAYSLMDNHCYGRINQRDPNIAWTPAQHINNQRLPHLDPWNKIQLGWITPTAVTTDRLATITAIDDPGGQIYKLQVPAHGDKEYFLIENRWAAGSDYDTNLLDSGLAIWHINENFLPDQHRAIALERAGGGANSGAATDFCNDDRDGTALWSGEEGFHANSSPSSDWSNDNDSGIAALCIGAPGPKVDAYLSVNWSQTLLAEDSAEPNNTRIEAETVVVPGTYNYSLHAPCDVDFFRFTTVDIVDLTITIQAFLDQAHQQPTSAPTLWLRNDKDLPLGTGQGPITRGQLPTGTYYLEVDSNAMIYYRLGFSTVASDIPPDEFDDQAPPGEPRNDSLANSAVLEDIVKDTPYPIASEILDLNHDITGDVDFFTVQLPPASHPQTGAPECCPTPLDPGEMQGEFRILIFPASDRPFEFRIYRSDGSTFASYTGLAYTLECPHAFFPDGRIRFSVRDPAGRNVYEALIGYSRCYYQFYPNWFLEYDPPLLRWSLPEFPSDDQFMFPIDPEVIFRYFQGVQTEPFPPEFARFEWLNLRDYDLNITLPEGGTLDVALVNEEGHVIAEAGPVESIRSAVSGGEPPPRLRLEVPDLPAGLYFLRVSGGSFGTAYVLDLELKGDINNDAAVDLRDVALFQRCFGTGGQPPPPAECALADLNANGRVDLPDVPVLVSALTGPH